MATCKIEYSRKDVQRAGDILRSARDEYEAYQRAWAVQVLSNWRGCHSYPINTFQATLRQKLQDIDTRALVAQRLKRMSSIILKLKRFPDMNLARMQDIGGLRAVVQSVAQVRRLAENYRHGRLTHKLVNQKDYIRAPKSSGYRGIHLVYKYQGKTTSEYDGLLLEIQLRTKLQHTWATAVETVGTYLDSALKSSEGPEEWLDFFRLTSNAFAHLEKCPAVPSLEHLSPIESYFEVSKRALKLDVRQKLQAYRAATNVIASAQHNGGYYLLVLNRAEKRLIYSSFARGKLRQATAEYLKYENLIAGGADLQAVLVSTESVRALRRAYPNYFLDTHDFLKNLDRVTASSNLGRSA